MSWKLIGVFTISITATTIFILIIFTNLNSKGYEEQLLNIDTLQSSLDSEQNYQKALESIDIFILDRDGFGLIPKQIEIQQSGSSSQNLKDVIQALL